MGEPLRIVVAKPGLDGHDRGAKVVARALRDAGHEVIYIGLRRSAQQIVDTVRDEDARFLGLSSLSGAHGHLFPKVCELLRTEGLNDVIVFGGGIIPEDDRNALFECKIRAIFGPGTPTSEILEFIQNKINKEGYSPSIREIAKAVNLKSTSSVQHHLNNLVKKGMIEKKANLSRSLTSNRSKSSFKPVPVVGFISAGVPLLAEENRIGEIPVPSSKFSQDLFALKINGESMIDAGIHDGDIVVVDKNQEPRNGDIGAFMIHDTEATVKYLDTVSGKKYLIPANKEFENIEVNENTQPIGKVVSLFRDI